MQLIHNAEIKKRLLIAITRHLTRITNIYSRKHKEEYIFKYLRLFLDMLANDNKKQEN